MKRFTADEIETLRLMAEVGHPATSIAKKLNRTPESIRSRAVALGIQFRAGKMPKCGSRFKIPDRLWQDISTAAIERGMKPTKFCHLLLQIAVKDQIIDAILDPVPGKAPAQKYAPAQRRAPAPSLGMLMTGPTLEGRIDGVQFEAVAPTYHLAGWLVVSTVTLSPSRMPRRFRRASSNRFLSSGSAWSRSSIKARRASWMIRFPGAPL